MRDLSQKALIVTGNRESSADRDRPAADRDGRIGALAFDPQERGVLLDQARGLNGDGREQLALCYPAGHQLGDPPQREVLSSEVGQRSVPGLRGRPGVPAWHRAGWRA